MSKLNLRKEMVDKECIVVNDDCMEYMKGLDRLCVDTVLTDIPYGEVSKNETRGGTGLRNMDKGLADIATFELQPFLKEVDRIASNNIIIFCGKEQFSEIYGYFANKPTGTTRCIVWEKSNPSPFNGQYVYLSGVEFAVWHRKPGGTFNAFCKNSVMKHSNGSSKNHPTEKNHKLLEEIVLDNTNEGEVIFDPCAGSFSTGLIALKNKRKFVGCELHTPYYEFGAERLKQYIK